MPQSGVLFESVLGQANAVLFCRLAELVVWGHQHKDLSAQYPELEQLLSSAGAALVCAGIVEPGGVDGESQKLVAKSEKLA